MHLVQNIDFQNGLLGGVILGISSSAFMFLTGKITGLSGIAEGIVSVKGENWNFTYIAGLVSAGALLTVYKPEAFGSPTALSTGSLLAAGLLTGFGTRLAGGCTSGHGLCGLSRRSPRSLAAVLTFMFTGAVTAHIARLPSVMQALTAPTDESLGPLIPAVTAVVGGLYLSLNISGIYKKFTGLFDHSVKKTDEHPHGEISSTNMHIASFATSLLFGLGLGVSGMCDPERVIRFLDFSGAGGWDPTLASVLGGGVIVTFLSFHWFKSSDTAVALHKSRKPLKSALNMGCAPSNMLFDWKLFVGSAMFGIGWGLAGMCPGPAMVVAGGGGEAALWKFVPSMAAGMVLKELLMG